jgi:hypothetical protein
MDDRTAIETAFFYASLASGVLFATVAIAIDPSSARSLEYFAVLLLGGLAFSLLACIVFALPIFLGLRYLGVLSGWWAVVSGLSAGFTMAAVTEWANGSSYDLFHLRWTSHSIGRAFAFGTIGAVSGLVFWWVYSRRKPPVVG